METTIESVIILTKKAADQVKQVRDAKAETQGKPLRIYAEGGGCCGMKYGMAFDDKQADDTVVSAHGVEVVVDGMSVNYLRGSTVDFDDSLQGAGFKIINPNADAGGGGGGGCGCSSGGEGHGHGHGHGGGGGGCGCSH
jgi:iron-sulfur cluster assembly accessory protein